MNECPVCKSMEVIDSIEITDMPVYCNVLWPDYDEAINAAKGNIHLGFCKNCGHIYNKDFDPELTEYSTDYENSLHFSPHFHQFSEKLAEELVDKFSLHEKDIIDIGCGKGDFLSLLCEKGKNRGLGFDKSYERGRSESKTSSEINFIQDFYTEKYADKPVDFICCRHVLEHIQYPSDFLHQIRKSLGNRDHVNVYFEVPNALYTIRDMGIWDLIYEHCSYFSPSSLTHAFNTSGFQVTNVGESFGGQYLFIECKLTDQPPSSQKINKELAELETQVNALNDKYTAKVNEWSGRVDEWAKNGKRAVVWGGGSKGVTFVNVLSNCDAIKYVIDLNPHKHGKYAPGTGQQVMAPEFLKEYQPDYVLVMNPLYLDEITQSLKDMGISAETLVV